VGNRPCHRHGTTATASLSSAKKSKTIPFTDRRKTETHFAAALLKYDHHVIEDTQP